MGYTHITVLLLCLLAGSTVYAYNNGVARTPPMGWNPWNHFDCDTALITQQMFMEMADAMVKSGMKDVGYEYINLDDCWLATTRDSEGKLQPDPVRFPDGIAYLADYVHSLGLKFGIYEDTGTMTCGGFPGSEGYYAMDAATYAEWGVDYVKLDGCYTNISDYKAIYTLNSELLNITERPMVFECSWPAYTNIVDIPTPYAYLQTICNLWREWHDIKDSWESWTAILDYQEEAELYQWSGPGNWNDPDMLEVGNGNQTDAEYRSLFSIWSMLAAPLIAGNDLRNMTGDTLNILTAVEIIAVDQDPLGKQGRRVVAENSLEVYVRELLNNTLAVALFNRSPETANITATWEQIGLADDVQATVRDLWARQDIGVFKGAYSSNVASHATVMVKLTPNE